MKAIIKDGDKEIGEIELNKKEFKTKSVGYHGFGKIEIDGKKHQANFLLIEVGSKERKLGEESDARD